MAHCHAKAALLRALTECLSLDVEWPHTATLLEIATAAGWRCQPAPLLLVHTMHCAMHSIAAHAGPMCVHPQVVFYEGSGASPVELAISIALGFTVLYAPLTIQSIGRCVRGSLPCDRRVGCLDLPLLAPHLLPGP